MSGKRILIVENEYIVAEDTKDILESLGYTIVGIVVSGAKAVQKTVELHPDLVLMDINLKGEMDGVQATEKIHADSNVPVIYVTAYTDAKTLQRAKLTEPYGYIVKPFKEKELLSVIEMSLYKHAIDKRLKESEQWLSTTLKSIGDAVITTDNKGLVTFMNPVAQALTGWEQQNAYGKALHDVFEVIDEKTRKTALDPVAQVLGENRIIESAHNVLLISKTGHEIPIDDRAAPIRGDDGDITGVVLVFRDITERVRTEAVRRQAEEALQKAHDELEIRVQERTEELVETNVRLKEEIAERVRAQESLTKKVAQLKALHRIGVAMSSKLDTNALLQFIVEQAAALVDAASCSVLLPNKDTEEGTQPALVFRAAVDNVVGMRVPPGQGIAARALRQRTSQIIHDVTTDPNHYPQIGQESGLPTRSLLAVPLLVGDLADHSQRAIGVLEAINKQQGHFDKQERDLLVTLANHAAIALDNAQMYEQEQREIARRVRLEQRLQAIYQLGQELTPLHDEALILRRMLEATTSVFHFDLIGYGLVDKASGELVYPQRIAGGVIETVGLHLPLDGEQGIGVVVVRDGQAINIPDLSQDPRYVAIIEGQARSELCVPMKIGERVIGVLNAESLKVDHFAPADEQLLQTLANQTAIALENARLYQATHEQVNRLATLNAISATITSSLDTETVLRRLLRETCRVLDAERGSILWLEPSTGDLIFALSIAGEQAILGGQRLPSGQGIAGWVAQHGQSMRVNDVRQDSRYDDTISQVSGVEIRSLLAVPLKYHEKVIAVIEIVNKRKAEFSDEDLSLLEAVSSVAAVALENARLFTSTQARANELKLLNEIGLAITSTLDFSEVVHAALSQAQRIFQADGISLLQPHPETGELEFVRALSGETVVEIPLRLSPGEGIAGWALEQRQTVMIEDTRDDARWSNRVDQYLDRQTRALMAGPLLVQERAIGVIEVVSSEPGIYTHDDLSLLQTLSSALAVALDNAHLYEEQKCLLEEQKRIQTQLIHSEKMAALGRLVASITHEINNPLQAVQGCISLVGEELANQRRPEKLDLYLGLAGGEIERVTTIVRRMRDFYRPTQEIIQSTNLHTVLESVLALTHNQLQHNDVTVELNWATDLPHVQANPDHLKQVFLNLVLNAIDAMTLSNSVETQGRTLRVCTTLDQLQRSPQSRGVPAVRIEFIDTGAGMPPEVQDHIFEPFFTTKNEGSGLGLSISYGIIESHNGQITVTSHIGTGTTFSILLPVEQPEKI